MLELVEGPTLADRIAHGAIPLDEALPIAKQIAEALEAAHEAGVSHRDLKPANIKVKDDGTVKVLDFGLAKALDTAPEGDPSQSPTLTAAATQMGVIMGTAAYMSPEQARGKPVNRQTDVWAFGAVLFEMLTGHRAFLGDDVSDALAAVLKSDPDWSTLPPATPVSVRRLLKRCLTKERQLRLREAGSAVIEIDDAKSGPDGPHDALHLRAWQRPTFAAVSATLLIVISVIAVWAMTQRGVPSSSFSARFSLMTRPEAPLVQDFCGQDVALSPDGRQVAYVSGNPNRPRIMLRELNQLDPVPLRGAEGGSGPFFSADGQWIAFVAGNGLKRVSVLGGEAQTVWESDVRLICATGSWGVNDRIVLAVAEQSRGEFGNRLLLVPANGGDAEAITMERSGPFQFQIPELLPDGDTVLLTVFLGRRPTGRMAQLSLTTGEITRFPIEGTYGRYSATGHLIYASGRTLQAVGFDPERLEVTSEPLPLVEGVSTKGMLGLLNFSVSDTGSLVYVEGETGPASDRTLLWVDRQGRAESVAGFPRGDYRNIRFSPNERMVAVDDGNDIWTYDLERQTLNQVTTDPVRDSHPVWTIDGERLVFSSVRNGQAGLFRKSADGTGDATPVVSAEGVRALRPLAWTPDGSRLLVMGSREDTARDVGVVSLESEPRVEWIVTGVSSDGWPSVSPDGRWIAYSNMGPEGLFQVYVERFPEMSERRRLSTTSGDFPLWSADGREVFYRSSLGNRFWAAAFDPMDTTSASVPEALFDGVFAIQGGNRMHDWSARMERFAVIAGASTVGLSQRIVVTHNWPSLLSERSSGD